MWKTLRSLAEALALGVVNGCCRRSIDRLKIRAAVWYVKGVAGARVAFMSYVALLALLLLGAAGFILLHVGLFIVLPLSLRVKGLLFLALGAVYLLVPLLALRRLCSQKTWMDFTRADDLVARVTGTDAGTKR